MIQNNTENITVYLMENLKNNKIYIGCTSQGIKAIKFHHKSNGRKISKRNSPIDKGMKKYGFCNFRYSIIGEFQSLEDAYKTKEACIKESKAMNPKYGYNCTTGRLDKFKMNKETKLKLSNASIGKTMPESFIKFMSERVGEKHPAFGIKRSKEVRENMKLGQLNSDYVQTEEVKNRKSETMKRRWKEPAVIEKMKNRKRGMVTEETRRKLSIASSGKNNAMYGIRGESHHFFGKQHDNNTKNKISKKNKIHALKRKEKKLELLKGRTEKECIKCKEIKPLNMYGKNSNSLDKLSYLCKECERKRSIAKYYKYKSPNKVRNRHGYLIKDILEGKMKTKGE